MRRGVFALAALAGCSLVTDLSSLSQDASTNDATTDAAPDVASDAPDAVSTAFCPMYADAGPLVYCMDFDSDAASALTILQSGATTATLDTFGQVSPPASFLLKMPIVDAGTGHAYFLHGMSVAPTVATLDFDIDVAAIGAPYLDLVELVFAESTGTRDLILQIDGTGLSLEEEYPVDAGFNTISHPHIAFTWSPGWHHVQMSIHIPTGAKTTSVVIDGTTVEANYPLVAGWTASLLSLAFGVTFAPTTSTAWVVRCDNVLVQTSL